ncbi:MAG: ImmA/IrrE family metallo-endopeptidase [Desulfarculaceae bacterium]|nr:ImmA/IrrE family metallo-endopeptidase [Desulfarculaceae bacterium]
MSFDKKEFASKLNRYCDQLQISLSELAENTGISKSRIAQLQDGNHEPTGDEVLILADFFKCDYRFFISNEKVAPFEETETLFRSHGDILSREDRWAIQTFLYLCEQEEFLQRELHKKSGRVFSFTKRGNYFKRHGEDAAKSLQLFILEELPAIPLDIFLIFRRIGLHIFRRKLINSEISGLFIKHPYAGQCVLVNYNEDIYRQRFSAAHEAGHAILDEELDFFISKTKYTSKDLSEIRAHTFASHFLIPNDILLKIPDVNSWTEEKAIQWAKYFKVSTAALAQALHDRGIINKGTRQSIKQFRVPKSDKIDSELGSNLSNVGKLRKKKLIEMGLSDYYVTLCFEAYDEGIISGGKLAEILLVPGGNTQEIHNLFTGSDT